MDLYLFTTRTCILFLSLDLTSYMQSTPSIAAWLDRIHEEHLAIRSHGTNGLGSGLSGLSGTSGSSE